MAQKMHEITLEGAAHLFRVHPRTILRALYNKHNTYWSDDEKFNHQMLSLEDIATAYNTSADILRMMLEGRDQLLKPSEAAELIGVSPRVFRKMLISGYPYTPQSQPHRFTREGRYGRIGHGRIVRYRHTKIMDIALARME